MKLLLIFATLLLLASFVHGRNAWETLRRVDLTTREMEEIREEKLYKTSIIVYDKNQMSDEDTDAEIARIIEKCDELGCPCQVIKLGKVGVLEVTWTCDNHPSVDDLGLDSTKETGAEDQLVELDDTPFPTDPGISYLWAFQDLDNNADINIAEGWEEYLSDAQGGDPNGPSVVVAVIDSGVDYNHPDLKDVMWTNPGEIAGDGIDNDGNGIIDDVYGADFTLSTSGSGDPMDGNSHGTHCAGTIAATPNNGKGVAGVTSFTQGKVKIMALKGLSGRYGSLSACLACLNYAIENGAKISSNSWGTTSSLPSVIEIIWDAVLRNNLDHLFIAAAGNDNRLINDDYRPMTCGLNEPNLLCVAASTINDERLYSNPILGSNYGPEYVHVFAPGGNILSTVPNGRYAYKSGTSMACPMVSGLAALIMTMRDGMSVEEVRRVIEANVRVKSEYSTYVSTSGLIDVGATLKALKGTDGNETRDVCFNVTITTTQWGKENSWVLGSCSNTIIHENHQTHEEECCLPPGEHTLECKDSYGDGWHGGFITINGTNYCENFKSSSQETHEVLIGSETEPEKLCEDIKIRTEDWGNENSYSIGTCASRQLPYDSNNDYVEECCLRPGTYTLDCKCTYGDGWHGGYVEIAGVRYCDDFLYGSNQTVAVEWSS